MYPFDTQVTATIYFVLLKGQTVKSQICTVLLKVRKLETASMVLSPKVVDMESETMLTQYIIRKW